MGAVLIILVNKVGKIRVEGRQGFAFVVEAPDLWEVWANIVKLGQCWLQSLR